MNMLPVTRYAFPPSQRGAASVAIAALILLILAAALATALSMSGSVARDAAMSEEQIEALFLAESGIERAAQLLSSTPCTSLPTTSYTLGSGSFNLVSAPVLDAGLCRVRVAGKVRQVTRTVDAWLSIPSGGAISAGTAASIVGLRNANTALTLSYSVPSGASILLVGLSFNNTEDNTLAAAAVSYGGTAMTRAAQAVGSNPWPVSQIWYMTNPPASTANVSVSISKRSEIILGALSFSGVNTITPFDVVAVTSSGNSGTASLAITPATNGAWVLDVLAINAGKTVTMSAITGQTRTSRWNLTSNGNAQGTASTIGPINPAIGVTPQWTWLGSEKWSLAAVALRPGAGSASVRRWSEVVN